MTGEDAWGFVRRFTGARVALGRAGSALSTREVLALALAHAQARDAIHVALDVAALESQVRALGFETRRVQSRAADRATYLARPDLGAALAPDCEEALRSDGGQPALVVVLADGLSSPAVMRHAVPVLSALRPWLGSAEATRVVIARQARVALGDAIGAALGAQAAIVLIGERPGLSTPDSLGAYLTLAPRTGRTNAERNCLSNIREGGLAPEVAAFKLAWLMRRAFDRGATGVALKDESDAWLIEGRPPPATPLLAT